MGWGDLAILLRQAEKVDEIGSVGSVGSVGRLEPILIFCSTLYPVIPTFHQSS